MPLFGRGFMITFTEVALDLEAEFNEWYNREHLDERIDLPGFRRARRYESLDGAIRYVTTYECREPTDIGSPAYLDVLREQTEWSRRIMPQFTKWHRLLGHVVVDRTHGFGGWLALLRLHPDPARVAALGNWLSDTVLRDLAARPGIVGACAVAADPAIDAILARAFGQQPDTSRPPEWGVLVEGMSIEAVRGAASGDLTAGLAGYASGGGVTVETCRFLYGNQRLDEVIPA
jgi:hypothetical protein